MRVKKGYATRRGKIVVEDAAAYVRDLAQRLEARGRLGATRSFIQHGDVSVYGHVLAVARASICMARVLSRVGIAVDVHALVRGALLHDSDSSHRLHGFRHPFFALDRAEEDFDLTPIERNIIASDVFPTRWRSCAASLPIVSTIRSKTLPIRWSSVFRRQPSILRKRRMCVAVPSMVGCSRFPMR